MLNRIPSFSVIAVMFAVVSMFLSGCRFLDLDEDLEKMDQATHLFAGTVETSDSDADGIVIVAMHDNAGKEITGFRMLSGDGPFEIRSERKPTWIFAFVDLNHDLVFQESEPFAWANDGHSLDPESEATDQVRILLSADHNASLSAPKQLVDEPMENKFGNYVKLNIGTITELDSALFSADQAEKGLWQPFEFTEDGGAGIHFLEAYDSKKIPVLFVHGINGTPQNFRNLIANLDKSKYQAWVVSYPSGMRLSWIARGIYQIIEVLNVQLKFDEMHMIAHSMGGLVSKGTLNICVQNRSCDYLRSYTTISTPWNGVASAENGTNWSPTVIPVWWDLVPSSEYITTLFDTPLPEGLSYHLLFGYRHDSLFGAESSDGVIKLTSQLRHEAQARADSIFGFDEGHVSILDSDATVLRVDEILSSN